MINCDMIKEGILDKTLAAFIAKAMLSFPFSISNLYNILHFVEFGVDPNHREEDVNYDRKYQMERTYRRINRIAIRLKETQKESPGAVSEPKCYDEILFDSMVSGYNRLCQAIGRPAVKVITNRLMQRTTTDDLLTYFRYDDHLVKCGYCVDMRYITRDGIALPEAIFYTALYMSTRARAIGTLNSELTKKVDFDRAQRWYKNFMTEFKSHNLYEAIIWEVFDMFFEKIAEELEDITGYSIQKFWLDEKYRDRKDRTRALQKLTKIIHNGEVSTTYLDKQLNAHPERSEEFIQVANTISVLEMMLYDIIPHAEMIALNRESKPTDEDWLRATRALERAKKQANLHSSNALSTSEYERASASYEELQFIEVASWLADLVVRIVNTSFDVAEKMLCSLPEAVAWVLTE